MITYLLEAVALGGALLLLTSIIPPTKIVSTTPWTPYLRS